MRSIARKLRVHLLISSMHFFGALRKRMNGRFGKAILADSDNGLLLVPIEDMFVGRKLCFNGTYDQEDLKKLWEVCRADSRVLVVGAHVGALAVPLARTVDHVAAVEANPATFELLRMNILLNGLQNVELHNVAAGDKSEKVHMLMSRLNSGGSKLQMGEWNRWEYIYDKPKITCIQMQRLDDVFPNIVFDLIVMDIEGSEARALRGMQSLLSRCRIMMIEVVGHHLRRIANVSNDEFVSLLEPYFDEAVVLLEHSRGIVPASRREYKKSAFGEMVSECCRSGAANILFRKTSILPGESILGRSGGA